MRGEKVEGSIFMGTILVTSCLSKHEVPVMYLTLFPRGNLSTQFRKLIIKQVAIFLKGALPGVAQQRLGKCPPAYFWPSAPEPVTVVGGLSALGNITHFIHAPSKSTKYQRSPGATLVKVVFSVKAVLCPGNSMGIMESHPVRASLACLLPSLSLFSPHPIQRCETCLLLPK